MFFLSPPYPKSFFGAGVSNSWVIEFLMKDQKKTSNQYLPEWPTCSCIRKAISSCNRKDPSHHFSLALRKDPLPTALWHFNIYCFPILEAFNG